MAVVIINNVEKMNIIATCPVCKSTEHLKLNTIEPRKCKKCGFGMNLSVKDTGKYNK